MNFSEKKLMSSNMMDFIESMKEDLDWYLSFGHWKHSRFQSLHWWFVISSRKTSEQFQTIAIVLINNTYMTNMQMFLGSSLEIKTAKILKQSNAYLNATVKRNKRLDNLVSDTSFPYIILVIYFMMTWAVPVQYFSGPLWASFNYKLSVKTNSITRQSWGYIHFNYGISLQLNHT